MTMLAAIFKHEVRLLLRKKILWLLMPLMMFLTLLVAAAHWQQQQTFRESQAHWQGVNDALWQAQPDRHPHRVAHYGSLAFQQASPLAFLEAGVNPYTGNVLFLEAHRQNSAGLRQFSFSAGYMALGYLSVATLILVLWPLLLITLGFSSISDERESGRLRLFASLGVEAKYLLLGKGLAYFFLSAGFLAFLFLMAAGFLFGSEWPDKSDATWRLLLLWVLYNLYCAVWAALVVCLSYWARTNSQSLISLVLAWIVLIILLPKGLPWVAQQLYPISERANFEVTLERALAEVGDAHNPEDPFFSAFRQATLKRYGVDHIDQLPVNWNGLLMAEGERLTSEVFQTHYQEVQATVERQARLRNLLALVSPYLLASHLSQVFSGSDLHAFYQFEQQAEDYRYHLIQQLNRLHTERIARENDREQTVGHQHWQQMPMFRHDPIRLGQLRRSAQWTMAGGLLYLLMLPALLITGFGRRIQLCNG